MKKLIDSRGIVHLKSTEQSDPAFYYVCHGPTRLRESPVSVDDGRPLSCMYCAAGVRHP